MNEQGPARAIKTADWEYITIRYTDEQVAATQGNRADRAFKTFLGLSGGISRAKDFHPGTFSADQLYHLSYDMDSQKNLAEDLGYAGQLKKMKRMLTKTVKNMGPRPYGDFVPEKGTNDKKTSQQVLDKIYAHHASQRQKKK